VPVDVDAPQARLHFILKDSGASLLVTRRGVLDAAPELIPPLLWVDDIAVEADGDNLDLPIPPDAAAYVIYTSGSTGAPKGVVVAHRNVLRLFTATRAWFGFGPRDVWSLFHSVAFDFSVWEIWGALLHGGRLVVVPYAVSRDPERFLDLLSREGVSVLNQTPSAFRQVAHAEAERSPAPPLALRYIVFGGEALDPTELAPWFSRHGDAKPLLVNMYGITETTVHVTYRPLTAADAVRPSSVIGRPIPDLSLYLLDRHLEPVPPGVPGELFVGGAGLAQGYLGHDQLTKQRFIVDPHHAGERLYRSGDRARRRSDGELEYLGRLDDQIKLRGFRIEPGEIAYVLRRHPGVRDAAVVLLRGKSQDAMLAAYYVPAGSVDESDLRTHLQRSLPPHMIPSALVAVPALPLTVNGKLDRRALPDPAKLRLTVASSEPRLPGTPAEAQVLEVWRALLEHPALGPDDNVFDQGAHSVLVVQARNRLRELLGREIAVALLFQYPTSAGLAAELERNAAVDPNEIVVTQERAALRRAAAQGRRRNPLSVAP
jgi:amino acid adenylation domain-containing protein